MHLLFISMPSLASDRERAFSFSPFVGAYSFDGTQHLQTEPIYGLRLGYDVTKNWAIEGVFAYTATSTTQLHQSLDLYSYRLDMLYNFHPDNKVIPYLATGGGFAVKAPANAFSYNDVTFNVGGGLKYFFTDSVAMRGDVRQLLVFADKTLYNWEYTVGLNYLFGDRKPAPSVAKPELEPVTEPTPVTAKYCNAPLAILFEPETVVIRDEYRDELGQLGTYMQKFPSATAVIKGYANDAQPPSRTNSNQQNLFKFFGDMELSQRRAESVRNYFEERFRIDPSRFTVKWFGNTQSKAAAGTAKGKVEYSGVDIILKCVPSP